MNVVVKIKKREVFQKMKKRNYKTPKLDVWAFSVVQCLTTSGNNFDMTESDFNGDNPFAN